jgi:hypothetical protein
VGAREGWWVLGCAAMAVVILSQEVERPLGSLSLWVYEAAVGARRRLLLRGRSSARETSWYWEAEWRR